MTEEESSGKSDKVPLFKSWSAWYALVLGFFVLLLVFFYFFTKQYS